MYKILTLPGDGIGPEVMDATLRVLGWFGQTRLRNTRPRKRWSAASPMKNWAAPIPMRPWPRPRPPMPCCSARWAARNGTICPSCKSRNAACCALARIWQLFANLRPALCFDALKDASSLKPEIVSGLDILIVRELMGGVYFGEPKETTTCPTARSAPSTPKSIPPAKSTASAALPLNWRGCAARSVASAEKSNVMVTGVLWREVVTDVAKDYPDVAAQPYAGRQLRHAAGAQSQAVRRHRHRQSVRRCAVGRSAQLTGSIGMLPSASLGAKRADGKQSALYEPIHGSAPDIAGKDLANPIASILSLGMACAIPSAAAMTRSCWTGRWSGCWPKAIAPATSCSRA